MPDRQPLSIKSSEFSIHDLCLLMAVCFLTTLPRIPPFELAEGIKSGAWLATIGAIPVAMLLAWMIFYLVAKRPDKTIPAIIEEILGKWAARALFAVFAVITLITLSMSLRFVSQRFVVSVYTRSPVSFFAFFIAAMGVYVARGTLQSIARLAAVVSAVSVTMITIILLLALGDLQKGATTLPSSDEMLPLIAKLPGEVSVYSLIVFMVFLTPTIAKKDGIQKSVLKLVGGLGLLMALSVFVSLGILGHTLIQYFSDPFFASIRTISSVQRPEFLLTLIWGLPCVLFVSVLARVTLTLVSATAGKPEYDPRLTAPILAVALLLAMIAGDNVFHLYGMWEMVLSMRKWFVLVVPPALLAIAKIRKKV